MPLNFPDTPTLNQTFTSGSRTWSWDGTTWVLGGEFVPNGSITTEKLANNSVTSVKIADGAVEETDIANNAATANKIASNAVTTAKILDSNVTNAKLANSNVTIGNTSISLGSTSTTLAGLTSATIANANVSTLLTVTSVTEPISISATAATGTISIDYISAPTLFYTSNAAANFTLNIRGNSTTTLNNTLSTNQVGTVTFLNTNGSTPYYANVVQVDGSTVTPKWQGGTAPTSGNASSIDSYTFTVVKTAANTYTVFGSQTKFA